MSSGLGVTAGRRYAAPPERVFRAFTEPALLARWFSPSADITIEVLAHELRPGGGYRFRYVEPDGSTSVVAGRFCEIERPSRLIFTWTWEPPDPHAHAETLVTVDIVADGDGTIVRVLHERFPDERSRGRHDAGWGTTLPRLDLVLR